MDRVGLSKECEDLKQIIDALVCGKETCEIGDDRYSFEDVIEYLQGYLGELKDLDTRIVEEGNTEELLKEVYNKYTELWLFQLSFTVESLPQVIGGLWRYPNANEGSTQ